MELKYSERDNVHYYGLFYGEEEETKTFHQLQLRKEVLNAKIYNIQWQMSSFSYPIFLSNTELSEQEKTDVLTICQNHIWLIGYKTENTERVSQMSFDKADLVATKDQFEKGASGYYDREGCINPKMTKAQAFATIDSFRTEYYRLKTAIEVATDKAGVDAAVATANFPTAIVG